jgi:hypothetical protein
MKVLSPFAGKFYLKKQILKTNTTIVSPEPKDSLTHTIIYTINHSNNVLSCFPAATRGHFPSFFIFAKLVHRKFA